MPKILLCGSLISILMAACAASAQDIVQVERATALVVVNRSATGTGFAVTPRHVVTAYHVIAIASADPGSVLVAVAGGTGNALRARVLASDVAADLAVLEVESLNAAPLTLGLANLEKGQEVVSVGFPGTGNFSREPGAKSGSLSLNPTVGRGNVAKVEPQLVGTAGEHQVVAHYAPTAPGNSGGPLVDTCSRVVAVTKGAVKADSGGATLHLASHAVATHRLLQRIGIEHAFEVKPCPLGGPSVAALAASMDASQRWTWTAVASVAAGVLLLALRRPRERIVRVIEQVSRRIELRARRETTQSTPHRTAEPLLILCGFCGNRSTAVRIEVVFAAAAELAPGAIREFAIGRSSALCHAVVDDPTVSRRHARVTATARGQLLIEDLNSAEGTRFNGVALMPFDPTLLRPGDSIAFGVVDLTVLAGPGLRDAGSGRPGNGQD